MTDDSFRAPELDPISVPRRRVSLDLLEIENPCPEPWDAMRGLGNVRHCRVCRQNVYNLSEMTADDAYELLERMNGELCVMFYRREDGTVVTADCTDTREEQVHRRRMMWIRGAAALVWSATAAALGAVGLAHVARSMEEPVVASVPVVVKKLANLAKWPAPPPPPPPPEEPPRDRRSGGRPRPWAT